jgi:hypothetical protein
MSGTVLDFPPDPDPDEVFGRWWWDADNQVWQTLGMPLTTIAAAEPVAPPIGLLWWNTANNDLNLWNGTQWNLVGYGVPL